MHTSLCSGVKQEHTLEPCTSTWPYDSSIQSYAICCDIMLLCFFFFFQAEDGIRDWSVTGVQTCALPISRPRRGVGIPEACGWSAATPSFPASSDERRVWTDSHCHISLDGVGAPAVAEARDAGVTRIVTVGTDAEESRAALTLARHHDGVWATVGLHPHEAVRGVESIVPVLEDALARGEVVAVGECCLDYHYDHSPRPVQRDAFAAQIALARRHDLALVIHTREAWDDTFAVLGAEGVPERTVFHCFTGGPDEARRCLALGAWLSFSGIVTFPNASDLRAAAAMCPLDRLLVETDSPFLAPVPHRGRPNRPSLVPVVGAGVAQVRGVPVPAVEEATWASAEAAFRLRGQAGPV